MREREGRYECALCGARIDLAPAAKLTRLFKTSSGGPRVRVLILDGKEIHSCEVKPA